MTDCRVLAALAIASPRFTIGSSRRTSLSYVNRQSLLRNGAARHKTEYLDCLAILQSYEPVPPSTADDAPNKHPCSRGCEDVAAGDHAKPPHDVSHIKNPCPFRKRNHFCPGAKAKSWF
ncbi:protein of unknown function (plasmid) [Cupriavidus taiwanensis]|uniref:Uncharacterized protein n=1 Tax=Cupriavidus taiwanensis TaxID=164546 RepID=A0A9Q7XV79_9BURK|nr:protein of unknown function [Cupriavidus taiwanensis]